jgi:hypothetical protein
MCSANMRDLDRLPEQVRDDYLRIVEWVVAELPSRRGARLGVPVLWLTLGASGGDEIVAEPTDLYQLSSRNGYPDEFSRWEGAAVRNRATETGARCVALVHHNWMSSSIQSPLLRAVTGTSGRNPHLFVRAVHRLKSPEFYASFPIERRWPRRLRFAPEVHEQLAQARRRSPHRTGSR